MTKRRIGFELVILLEPLQSPMNWSPAMTNAKKAEARVINAWLAQLRLNGSSSE